MDNDIFDYDSLRNEFLLEDIKKGIDFFVHQFHMNREENIKKWVVTLNIPKKETVYYNINNEKDIKDVKFRAILELQYKLEEKAKEYLNYCDLISNMV